MENLPAKVGETVVRWKRKERIQHQPAEVVIRPREPQPDEMMRTRHNLVMEMRIQEAFEARQAIRAAVRGERGVHKIAPVVINDRKITEDFAGREHKAGAQFVRAEFKTKILRFAAADRALGFRLHGVNAPPFFLFIYLTPKLLRQKP